jgi:hypothetical protein
VVMNGMTGNQEVWLVSAGWAATRARIGTGALVLMSSLPTDS